MPRITNKQYFYLNSNNRVSGTSSDFLATIPNLPSWDVTHVSVVQASVPKTYYLIDTNNDNIVLDEDGSQQSITLTHGNYTLRQWLAEVTAQLNANSPNGYTYALSFPGSTSPQTGKIQFSTASPVGGAHVISFIFTDECYEQFGFSENSTNTFTYDSGTYYLTSDNCIKLQSEDALFLRSDLTIDNDACLTEIFTGATNDFTSYTFQNQDPEATAKRIVFNRSDVYHFYLQNEENKNMNLNGINFVASLMFFKIEDDEEDRQLLRDALKYLVYGVGELINPTPKT